MVRPDLFERVMRRVAYLERTWNATTTNVDIAKIKSSPPVHDELPFNLISRIRLIRAALLDVYPNSMLYWIEGFRRDAHPSREVRIWEHVASCYLEYVVANSLSKEQRKNVFSIVFALSICISEDELAKKASLLPFNALTELVRLWKTEVLTNDVGQIPFPSHYEMSEQSMERLKLLDTEQFPYDIPDELVFELLKQKPLDDA